jgi:hypothetical protein
VAFTLIAVSAFLQKMTGFTIRHTGTTEAKGEVGPMRKFIKWSAMTGYNIGCGLAGGLLSQTK